MFSKRKKISVDGIITIRFKAIAWKNVKQMYMELNLFMEDLFQEEA